MFKVGDKVRVKPWYRNSTKYKGIHIDKALYEDALEEKDLVIIKKYSYTECGYHDAWLLTGNIYVSENLLIRKPVLSNKPLWF